MVQFTPLSHPRSIIPGSATVGVTIDPLRLGLVGLFGYNLNLNVIGFVHGVEIYELSYLHSLHRISL